MRARGARENFARFNGYVSAYLESARGLPARRRLARRALHSEKPHLRPQRCAAVGACGPGAQQPVATASSSTARGRTPSGSCSRASSPFNGDTPASLYRVADRLDDAQFATLLHALDQCRIVRTNYAEALTARGCSV